MSDDCRAIDGRTTLREFIERYVHSTGRRCFIVEKDGAVKELVTRSDVRGFAPERWHTLCVREDLKPMDSSLSGREIHRQQDTILVFPAQGVTDGLAGTLDDGSARSEPRTAAARRGLPLADGSSGAEQYRAIGDVLNRIRRVAR